MIRGRRAGIGIPLFSIRSRQGWGIGELGDLPAIAKWMHAAGQSVLQVLPLNELAPDESSPYSALSAMAIDPQFISIWMLDDGAELEAMNRDEIEAIRRAPRIDFRRVRDLKMRVLRGCFERFYENEWRPGPLKAAALRWFVDR